jgi:hypothetical protein
MILDTASTRMGDLFLLSTALADGNECSLWHMRAGVGMSLCVVVGGASQAAEHGSAHVCVFAFLARSCPCRIDPGALAFHVSSDRKAVPEDPGTALSTPLGTQSSVGR